MLVTRTAHAKSPAKAWNMQPVGARWGHRNRFAGSRGSVLHFQPVTIQVSLSKLFWFSSWFLACDMIDPVHFMCCPRFWPRFSDWLVDQTEGEHSARFLVFFLTLVSHFIILGHLFCPRAICSLRPPWCWLSLENPEAEWHLRFPYQYGSVGWALVDGKEGAMLPVFFSLGKEVSAWLAVSI